MTISMSDIKNIVTKIKDDVLVKKTGDKLTFIVMPGEAVILRLRASADVFGVLGEGDFSILLEYSKWKKLVKTYGDATIKVQGDKILLTKKIGGIIIDHIVDLPIDYEKYLQGEELMDTIVDELKVIKNIELPGELLEMLSQLVTSDSEIQLDIEDGRIKMSVVTNEGNIMIDLGESGDMNEMSFRIPPEAFALISRAIALTNASVVWMTIGDLAGVEAIMLRDWDEKGEYGAEVFVRAGE